MHGTERLGRTMYEELIRVLRHCGNPNVSCKGCSDEDDCIGADGAWEIGAMGNMRAAAEAIEELSRRETPMKITEIHVDEYYCPACGAENNCDQGYVQDAYCPACGQRLLPEPPKEE